MVWQGSFTMQLLCLCSSLTTFALIMQQKKQRRSSLHTGNRHSSLYFLFLLVLCLSENSSKPPWWLMSTHENTPAVTSNKPVRIKAHLVSNCLDTDLIHCVDHSSPIPVKTIGNGCFPSARTRKNCLLTRINPLTIDCVAMSPVDCQTISRWEFSTVNKRVGRVSTWCTHCVRACRISAFCSSPQTEQFRSKDTSSRFAFICESSD